MKKEVLVPVLIGIGTIVLFALTLGLSAPMPLDRQDIPYVPRTLVDSVIPSVLFLGFVYLHNRKAHVVNVCLSVVYFSFYYLFGKLPEMWQF
jgi:hypothetical protein